jgi:succinoglycan biosynthesis protein ExoW
MPGVNDGTTAQRPRVVVIIPFYQRATGILPRALASVFAQEFLPAPTVLVVDDASPVPAAGEIATLPPDQAARVRVICQENAGPGAARNRALEALGDDVDYVAYLDSDDEWVPGHLARAVGALEAGHDFYFSNYRDIGSDLGGFEVRGHLHLEEHDPVPGRPDVYHYTGDLRDAILDASPVETSTVVFRRATFGHLRFRREFRYAYEDLMYWFDVAASSSRIAFSPVVGTQYGEGVNVYRSIEPNSDIFLRALVGSTMFGAGVRRAHRLTANQRSAVGRRIVHDRRALAFQVLFRVRRRMRWPVREVSTFLKASPSSWLLLPVESARLVVRWVTGRGFEP